jgi:hypothetical protein
MANAKIEVKVGAVSFTAEGAEGWLTAQLGNFMQQLPQLLTGAPSGDPAGGPTKAAQSIVPNGSGRAALATFLNLNDRRKNQTRKFLATAAWLHQGGKNRLSTRDVSEALSKNNQGKLSNAAQCLNDNVAQGLCEKDGGQFYVMDEGLKVVG